MQLTFEDVLVYLKHAALTENLTITEYVEKYNDSIDTHFTIKCVNVFANNHRNFIKNVVHLFEPESYHRSLIQILLKHKLSPDLYRLFCDTYPEAAIDPTTLNDNPELLVRVSHTLFPGDNNVKRLAIEKAAKQESSRIPIDEYIMQHANLISDNMAAEHHIDLNDNASKAYLALSLLGRI